MENKEPNFATKNLKKATLNFCRQYQIKPLRRRGQNFLINHNVLNKILEAAELEKDDFVLEIGSGFGFLTEEIAKRVKKIIAVEIDQRFIEVLKEQLQDYKNIEIVQGDILDPKIDSYIRKRFVIRSRYKIIANLPYNITGQVLRKFLASEQRNPRLAARDVQMRPSELPKPELMVLMLQKEVAERICSRPPRMSLLSVLVQFYSQPKIISRVSKESFWPKPKVESAIVKILIKKNPPQINEGRFFSLLRTGFQQPRKYLLNNLIKSATIKESKDQLREILSYLDKDPKVRPSELSVEDWIKLFKKLNSLICANLATNFTNNYL